MNKSGSMLIAIGGGKGGVGKSFIASNLACGFARQGGRVIVVDADLAGANIHTLFGIKYPEKTLRDFLNRKVEKFSDILIPTEIENVELICGAASLLEIANPKFSQKQKLLKGIESLNARVIIIDIGAGASYNNLDFFNLADSGIIVSSPAPTAIQNAYAFLKMALHRKILSLFPAGSGVRKEVSQALQGEGGSGNSAQLLKAMEHIGTQAFEKTTGLLAGRHYKLIINMANALEGEKVASAISAVAYQFLGITLPYVGRISFNRDVERSIRKMEPIMLKKGSPIAAEVESIVKRLSADDSEGKKEERAPKKSPEKERNSSSKSDYNLVLNDDVMQGGIKLHVQTEDLGPSKGQVVSIVFHGGEVLFSKEMDYEEFLRDGNSKDALKRKIKWQHKTIITGIKRGKLEHILSCSKGEDPCQEQKLPL